MQLISFLLRSSPKLVAIAIFMGLLSGASSAGLIALISRALGSPNAAIGQIAGAFVGLAILSLVTSVISQVVLIRLAQDAVFHLRLQLSRQILSSELRHLEQLGNARMMATLTEDVQAVATAVSSFPFLCIELATVVGCFVFIGSLSWVVFAMVMGLFAFTFLTCQWLLNQARRRMVDAREDQDALFRHFRSITDGIKELKLHSSRRQVFLNQELETTSASFRRHNIYALILYASAGSWGKLIFFFAIGFLLFALPSLLSIPIETLSGYVLTFTYLTLPLDKLILKLPILSQASVSLQKIEALGLSLKNRAEAANNPAAVTFAGEASAQNWRQIKLHNVAHSYYQSADTQFKLGDINLTLNAGEIVFIVGGNGSGKSTLAKLLTGLYAPESGAILLDGTPITNENREWYRQHFSTVFADFYLFDRLLGLDATDQEAQSYLQQLQLDHKVQIRNGQFSTTELSQGQRKRLALLTAYLEDRPIYLFDEWASDQDPTFRELFYTEFLPKLKHRGKTVWVISHDDHYFGYCDRLIKLDYGQVEYDHRNES
ncbi:cyclic peptide export ABC transporter [Leptolyngbya sp. FACHB-17]|uniref:cyclic peptide export ABC transporter n=1 Tax=unclassified Leptolyngbya TaxID=2650499 RepID=UPI0016800F54|nr:cyclic peptide export ABC transporter [Leptolyngbya sp. FACHB-17]MBD2083243.1 cyclic peptide export ABC transporter [Leptolyngbya sp. FACHB-17]